MVEKLRKQFVGPGIRRFTLKVSTERICPYAHETLSPDFGSRILGRGYNPQKAGTVGRYGDQNRRSLTKTLLEIQV